MNKAKHVTDEGTLIVATVRMNIVGLEAEISGPNGGDTLHLSVPAISLPDDLLHPDVIDTFERNHVSPQQCVAIEEQVRDLVQHQLLLNFLASRIR